MNFLFWKRKKKIAKGFVLESEITPKKNQQHNKRASIILFSFRNF